MPSIDNGKLCWLAHRLELAGGVVRDLSDPLIASIFLVGRSAVSDVVVRLDDSMTRPKHHRIFGDSSHTKDSRSPAGI